MFDEGRFKVAMRRLASGVSIITTVDADGEWRGFLATAVSSVSANPPTILICVNQSGSSHDALLNSRRFCVNFLGARSQDVVESFKDSEKRSGRFQMGTWKPIKTGAPALVGSLASLDCRVTSNITIHTHTIVFGEVEEIELGAANPESLVYLNGRYQSMHLS
ncbi:flavin reductase family protein [Bradyrhizobium diazoefficiens]|uniref:flavin reductase family protein n=1 Tax=Bradyrhizobium diazoefficiens TaxID=1355477 RepID=UPI00346A5630